MIDQATLSGLCDEMEKIALSSGLLQRAAHKSMQRAGGRMTAQAQKFHAASWGKQQALKKSMAPRLKSYQAMQGRMALKPKKPGFFSRVFGRGVPPKPAFAGA